MQIVLVPGLWLNASTWDAVVPDLEAAGHTAHPLTLPGMGGKDADRTGITLADHVAAVVAAVDAAYDAGGPVLLVSHSAGCGIAHCATDARPDKVARQVHVGGFPSADGEALLSGLPAEGGEVPMPDWKEMGEDANVQDFTDEQLATFYAAAIPVPEAVVTTPVRLGDERRYDVPATEVCPEYSAADLEEWVGAGHLPELARIKDVEHVDLGGGHWPQLTQPKSLAQAILDAAR
jgi:pimeloyl-ACP methyl ester carboxylesterase